MKQLTIDSPVADFVTDNHYCTTTLNKYGIDFCCGGQRPLSQACAEKNLDPENILTELAQSHPPADSESVNWGDAPLLQLTEHILDTHHVYVKQELPRLSALVDKVAAVYPLKYPWVTGLKETWDTLSAELEAHLMKEEQVLFPRIKELCQAEAGAALPAFHCGSVHAPIEVMEHEHDNAGEALRHMRKIANDYTPPADACTTFKLMLQGLEAFEADLHQHVHKENNIMFPKVLELETRLLN